MRNARNNIAYPGRALKAIKSAIGVWHYLNDADVKQSFVNIERDVRYELLLTQRAWEKKSGTKVPLANAWHEFLDDFIPHQVGRTSQWVHYNIGEMRRVWQGVSNRNRLKPMVLSTLRQLEGFSYAIINYDLDAFDHEIDIS